MQSLKSTGNWISSNCKSLVLDIVWSGDIWSEIRKKIWTTKVVKQHMLIKFQGVILTRQIMSFMKSFQIELWLKKQKEMHNAKVGRAMQYATAEHCPYLYKKGGISEISAFDLTNQESIADNPRCKQNDELTRLLCIENLPFWEKIMALTKTKAIWKKATENLSFQSNLKMTSIKNVFNATKKGSRNYKKILQSNLNKKNQPSRTFTKL